MAKAPAAAFDFEKFAAAMIKDHGKNEETMGPPCWPSSGFLPLDYAMSGRFDGGFPGGRIVEIYGPESSGKTWLATQAMIACQKMGGVAGFNDHERSFMKKVGEGLGLDTRDGMFYFMRPRTYEDSIEHFKTMVEDVRAKGLPLDRPICWVFDSLAAMIPQQKLEKGVSKLNMNDTTALARLTSSTFPMIAQIAEENNVLVIFINQLRVKPGVVYGDPNTTPGGNAPKFYASIRIQLGATRLTKKEGAGDNEVTTMIGQQVTARCIKNKVSRPFVTTKWRFMFGEDGIGRFDVAGSLVEFAVLNKILPVEGGYVLWEGGKFFKPVLARKLEAEGKVGVLSEMIAASGVEPEAEAPPGDDEPEIEAA